MENGPCFTDWLGDCHFSSVRVCNVEALSLDDLASWGTHHLGPIEEPTRSSEQFGSLRSRLCPTELDKAVGEMAAAARAGSPVARRRSPLSPRTKLFQMEQLDQLRSLDIFLLNISSEAARKQLRADFAAKGDSLEREEFVEAVLRILPETLQFRSPFGMGDGVENATLNLGVKLTASQRRAAVSSLVDRVDTDGDGYIDWGEMSAFILYQSAIVSQSDFTVGRILAYRPIHETGSLASTRKQASTSSKDQELIMTTETNDHLVALLQNQQAATSQVIPPAVLSGLKMALRNRPKSEVIKTAAEMKAEEKRLALIKLKGGRMEQPARQAKLVSGPEGAFNKSGIYGGVSLVHYVPEIDKIAVVEPKAAGVRLLQPDDLSEFAVLTTKGRAIEAVTSFSGVKSHTFLAAASANSTISIFDLGDPKKALQQTPKKAPMPQAISSWPTPASQQCLLYSHRYSLLLSGSSAKGAVHTWNARTGSLLSSMTGHADMCTGLVELSEEDRVVSVSHDKTVRVWDLSTCRVESVLRGHRRGLCGVALYEERGLVVSASYDHTAKVWSPRVSSAILTLEGHSAPLVNVASVPGTPEVITASMDGDVCVWDMRRGSSPVHRFTVEEGALAAAESGDGSAEGGSHMTTFALCVRKLKSEARMKLPRAPQHAGVTYTRGVPFVRKMPIRTPIGTEAVALTPKEVGLTATGWPSVLEEVVEPVEDRYDLASSPSSPVSNASGKDPRSRMVSGASAASTGTGPKLAGEDAVREVADSGPIPGSAPTLDHEKMARRPKQAEVAERQVQQLVFGIKTLHSFTQQETPELLQCSHQEPVVAVGYSPLNHTILSAAGSSVRVWSAIVGVLTRVFEHVSGEEETISAMVVDPRGVTFAIGTESGLVQLHNATSGHRLRKLSSHSGHVSGLAWFSLGIGLAVVSGGWDGKVLLHSVKETPGLQPDQHTELGKANPARGRVTCVAVVTSSRARDEGTLSYVLAGDAVGSVRVFNTSTGQCVKVMRHAGMVTAIVTVPELDIIITTDVSSSVLVWSVRTAGASFGLMAGFRHTPADYLDRTGNARKLFEGQIAQQKKHSATLQAQQAAMSEDDVDPTTHALMTPRTQDRVERNRERNRMLARHEERQAEVRTDIEQPSLAERLVRGEPGAAAEFEESRRVAVGTTRKSFRNSILLSRRGASLLSDTGRSGKLRISAAGDTLPTIGLSSSKIAAPESLATPSVLDTGLLTRVTTFAGSPVTSAEHPARGKRFSAPPRSMPSVAASGAGGVALSKDLLQFTKQSHVLHLHFSLDDYALFTADDEGFVNRWEMKPLLLAMEMQARGTAKKIGLSSASVKRRLSVDISDEELSGTLREATGQKSAAEKLLSLIREVGATGGFRGSRQAILPPGSPAPLVNAAAHLELKHRILLHEQGVTGMAMMRNPHMPETLLTCGFDKCVRGSTTQGLYMLGKLCQSLTKTGVNPEWHMDVDAESWLTESDGRVLEAHRATDASVKHSMALLSGAEPIRRARSRTVAMVNSGVWKTSSQTSGTAAEWGAEDGHLGASLVRRRRAGPAVDASEPTASPGPLAVRRRGHAVGAAGAGWLDDSRSAAADGSGRGGRGAHASSAEGDEDSLAMDELDLFTRAAASVPLPEALRFSLGLADAAAPQRKRRIQSVLQRMHADDAMGGGGADAHGSA